MIVSINQPAYMPWLGYFDRINKSDVHIVLDNVQFEKNSVVNRNKIKTNQGWSWLTIPVKTKGEFGNLVIKDLEIDNTQKWQHKHYVSLLNFYKKSTYFGEHNIWLEQFYKKEWKNLGPMLDISLKYLIKALGISTPLLNSSEMVAKGKKSDYILNLCLEAGATTYLSGPFGRDYLDIDRFVRKGINVDFHDYSHPEYRQIYGEFIPYMSIVDLIFNEGPRSLEILTRRLN